MSIINENKMRIKLDIVSRGEVVDQHEVEIERKPGYWSVEFEGYPYVVMDNHTPEKDFWWIDIRDYRPKCSCGVRMETWRTKYGTTVNVCPACLSEKHAVTLEEVHRNCELQAGSVDRMIAVHIQSRIEELEEEREAWQGKIKRVDKGEWDSLGHSEVSAMIEQKISMLSDKIFELREIIRKAGG